MFEEISSVICKKCKVESEVCPVTVPRGAKGEGQFVPLTKHFLSVSVTVMMEELEGSPNLLTAAGFNACNVKLQTAALTTIRKAVSFPSDIAFRSMDHSSAQDLNTFSERVLQKNAFELGCDSGSIPRYSRERERKSYKSGRRSP